MNIEHFNYLLEVINCGSINKASQQLHIKQQQLSRIIASMEDKLGTKIFIRSSKGVKLTQNGKMFVERIKPLVSEINDLVHYFSTLKNSSHQTLNGNLFVCKFPSITAEYYTKFIDTIIQKHPNVSIHLEESSLMSTMSLVEKNPDHVGIILLVEPQQTLIPDSLEFIPILNRFPVVYASSTSAFAKKHKSTSLKTLLNEPLIEYRPFTSSDNLLELLFSNVGMPKVKYTVSNLKAFYDSLHNNEYLSVGTSHLRILHEMEGITIIPIRDRIDIKQGLLINKSSKANPLIKMYIDSYLEFYGQFMISE